MNYITPSLLLPNELREALNTHEILYFSGQPIQYTPFEDEALNQQHMQRYENCKEVVNIPLFVRGAVVRYTSRVARPHRHLVLENEFLAISGVHIETQDEYWFGDRPDFPFSIHTDPLSEPQSCLWRDSNVV